MKICINCGNTNEDNLDQCSKCGKPIKKEEIVNAPIPEPNKEI